MAKQKVATPASEAQDPTPTQDGVERKGRSEACAKEIETILQKYNCRIEPSIILAPNRITPNLTVIANDVEPETK